MSRRSKHYINKSIYLDERTDGRIDVWMDESLAERKFVWEVNAMRKMCSKKSTHTKPLQWPSQRASAKDNASARDAIASRYLLLPLLDNGDMKCIVSDYWSLPANKSSVLLLLSVLAARAIKYIYWNRLWCCHNFTTNFSHIYGKTGVYVCHL